MIEIGGLQKTTLIDYPGQVAATVFLIGCNFRCPWCYSKELVLPEIIKKQPRVSEKELFDFLKEKKGLIEGVVVCGGEPTIQKDLPVFLKKIKELGFSVKLDTNGSNPEMLKKLIEEKLVDYVAMDVKAPKEKYGEVVGVEVDVNKIQKSIDILKEGKVDYEFRTTVVPSFHSKEDILRIAKWLGSDFPPGSGQGKYYLQNFRAEKTINPEFEKVKPYSKEFLSEIQKETSHLFKICQVRG
jgi:pyruvate formate lyase activating enzyme